MRSIDSSTKGRGRYRGALGADGASKGYPLPNQALRTYVRVVPGNWRSDFRFAWQTPDPEPNEGPGLTWRQLTPRDWSGSWNGKLHGTVTADGDSWLAYVRLEDPPGLSPITTVGRFDTIEAAQVATDDVWAAR
jgi:hypothetical protein